MKRIALKIEEEIAGIRRWHTEKASHRLSRQLLDQRAYLPRASNLQCSLQSQLFKCVPGHPWHLRASRRRGEGSQCADAGVAELLGLRTAQTGDPRQMVSLLPLV